MTLKFNDARAEVDYRDATRRQKMPGVTAASFTCPFCRQIRLVRGRRKVGGLWRCWGCVAKDSGA